MVSLKNFIISLFWKQNSWHAHGVFIHTARVTWYIYKMKEFKMIPAAILHDIGKPFVAFQKPEDIIAKEFSFTDHEEVGYQIIKNWPFISEYTKDLVRYHYLIRDIKKSKVKNLERFAIKQDIWDSLSEDFQSDLKKFIQCDDKGKGKL